MVPESATERVSTGLLLTSIGVRDYPVVQGIVLVIATIFVLINFLTDISFALFDPRIQHK